MYTPAQITKKIGKDTLTFHFGMGAFHIFCEERKIDLQDIQKEFERDQMGALADILHATAKFSLLLKGEEPTFNRYTAFTWIDQMGEKDLNDIMDTFSKAQLLGQGVSGNQKRPRASRGQKK